MTFDEIKKRVGSNIKYYSASGWLTGRDVTETDIGDYVNEVYTEDMFPLFASRYPHMFRQTGLLNSWILTATVNASSTGSTLVIDTDADTAFANAMVGLTVYNSTDDETRVIEAYVDTDEVTVDIDIDDTWDGDTIWILGQEFAFGGEATDIFTIERIKVKYSSTDIDYKICELRDKQDIFVTGSETGTKAGPVAYLTTVLDGNNMYNAIGIFPGFDEKVTNAIEIDYIAKPAAITGAAVTPVIPVQASMIAGATMKAYEKKQDAKMASYWRDKYILASKQDISRFRPQTSNVPVDMKINRNASYMHRRII